MLKFAQLIRIKYAILSEDSLRKRLFEFKFSLQPNKGMFAYLLKLVEMNFPLAVTCYKLLDELSSDSKNIDLEDAIDLIKPTLEVIDVEANDNWKSIKDFVSSRVRVKNLSIEDTAKPFIRNFAYLRNQLQNLLTDLQDFVGQNLTTAPEMKHDPATSQTLLDNFLSDLGSNYGFPSAKEDKNFIMSLIIENDPDLYEELKKLARTYQRRPEFVASSSNQKDLIRAKIVNLVSEELNRRKLSPSFDPDVAKEFIPVPSKTTEDIYYPKATTERLQKELEKELGQWEFSDSEKERRRKALISGGHTKPSLTKSKLIEKLISLKEQLNKKNKMISMLEKSNNLSLTLPLKIEVKKLEEEIETIDNAINALGEK